MTQELKDLLAKINTIQSYSFIDHQTKDEYLIRDDKIRINLFQKRGTKELGQYDTVYLDTTNKKAYGICLDKLCDIRLREKYLTPSYDTYKLEQTPVARVKAIQYAELTGRTQQIHNVPTYQIVFTENNITTEMWLHNFYAYPMEIKITKKGIQTNISFDKVTINNINIEEVTLPSSYTPLEWGDRYEK